MPFGPLETGSQRFFAKTGAKVIALVSYFGGVTVLALQTFQACFRTRFSLRAFLEQMEFIGIRSLSLVNLMAIFSGMVLALQFAIGLGRFGLKLYVGQVIGIAIVRELGPVLTSLMIAARVGAGIASEIGSMVVTEQVLAIEALGANPVQKLVVPRVLATMLAAPLLTTVGNLIGILGGMVITVMEAGVTPIFYWDQIRRTVRIEDFLSGTSKSLFFGFLISLVACYEGLRTRGGTEGVGRATTHAVVWGSLVVFVADFFLTKLFILL